MSESKEIKHNGHYIDIDYTVNKFTTPIARVWIMKQAIALKARDDAVDRKSSNAARIMAATDRQCKKHNKIAIVIENKEKHRKTLMQKLLRTIDAAEVTGVAYAQYTRDNAVISIDKQLRQLNRVASALNGKGGKLVFFTTRESLVELREIICTELEIAKKEKPVEPAHLCVKKGVSLHATRRSAHQFDAKELAAYLMCAATSDAHHGVITESKATRAYTGANGKLTKQGNTMAICCPAKHCTEMFVYDHPALIGCFTAEQRAAYKADCYSSMILKCVKNVKILALDKGWDDELSNTKLTLTIALFTDLHGSRMASTDEGDEKDEKDEKTTEVKADTESVETSVETKREVEADGESVETESDQSSETASVDLSSAKFATDGESVAGLEEVEDSASVARVVRQADMLRDMISFVRETDLIDPDLVD
ncbi:MAG: hypothetical protein Faunusvirus3_27 [Faunusvirus sp.]|jgi:hypothetical protein|uniref:Uncharacterized protein n=1 Tax=Faunusvirus sp. TaxID=2487766 RepID=A0A3G4ZW73_9VIRU|nr:MAG: hypothetical protein Faunusvirus3_27 [Faunusvirus sp.]